MTKYHNVNMTTSFLGRKMTGGEASDFKTIAFVCLIKIEFDPRVQFHLYVVDDIDSIVERKVQRSLLLDGLAYE